MTQSYVAFWWTPWNRNRHWLSSNIQCPNNMNFSCLKRNYVLYTLIWDDFEDEDGQKSCFPSTWYYLSTVLTSHFRLNSSPTGHLFNPFQLNRRCNYQKSMGPGPLTNTRHFAILLHYLLSMVFPVYYCHLFVICGRFFNILIFRFRIESWYPNKIHIWIIELIGNST